MDRHCQRPPASLGYVFSRFTVKNGTHASGLLRPANWAVKRVKPALRPRAPHAR